jgi:hypothetical protein
MKVSKPNKRVTSLLQKWYLGSDPVSEHSTYGGIMRLRAFLFLCLSCVCFASGYVRYEYDEGGAVILEQVVDPNGVVLQDVRRAYDVVGNLFLERMVAFPGCPDNADDLIIINDYDVAGNLLKTIQKGSAGLFIKLCKRS